MTEKERLNELQKKFDKAGGIFGLETHEQEEYKALRKKITEDDEKAKKKKAKDSKPKSSGKKITIEESELMKLVEDIINKRELGEKLDDDDKLYGKWKEFKEVKGNNQTAKLKTYRKDSKSEKGLIVKVEELRTELDPKTGRHDILILGLTVLYPNDKTEEVEVTADEYIRLNEVETVELIENKRTPMVKSIGTVIVTPKDKSGYIVRSADNAYGRSEGGYETDLEVHAFKEVFTVRTKKGQEFEIDSKHLNN